MAVAHDAVSESHSGTTSSTSETDFSWTHTPVGTPKGVIVFTFVGPYNGASRSTTLVSGVTYGGVSLGSPVPDARAVDTVGLPGDCTVWCLGSGIGTGAKAVTVTRPNNAANIYAICITVTAAGDTECTGMVLLEEDQALAEQSVDDGSTSGTNSVRYAGVNSGMNTVPTTGANSTALASIDYGIRTCAVVRETTAGQGARSVGFTEATVDDVAAVHVAIRESTSPDASPTPTTVAGVTTIPTPAVTGDADVTPDTVVASAVVPEPATSGDVANASVTLSTVVAAVTIPTPAQPAYPGAARAVPSKRIDVRIARMRKGGSTRG